MRSVINPKKAEQLVELILWINSRGWSPATSTNYSFKNSENPISIAISHSGIDKSKFGTRHLMLIDADGKPLPDFSHLKSSAETYLHTVLYQENPEVEVILHTHSVYATILSQKYLAEGSIVLENYEVLKGLGDIKTHEVSVAIPIFQNTQDIAAMSEEFRTLYRKMPEMQGYLIAGHGLYTWGKSFEIAKRHLEVLEFLLECEWRKGNFKG
jgi:methylthioribulose-1-phosphate dehydratase